MTRCDKCGHALPDTSGIAADPETGEISRAGRTAKLTRRQFQIFDLLHSRNGRTASMDQIMGHLYSAAHDEPAWEIVRTFISKARIQLEPLGIDIRNVHSFGYVLEIKPLEAA